MIYKCQNCGGNVIYDPDRTSMYCPYCESQESQVETRADSTVECVNCGAPIETNDYTAALKCQHCGSYLILNERVEGVYEPHLVLPFKISRKKAEEIMKREFKRKIFMPGDFLKTASLSHMEGSYVPFWLYDFHVRMLYQGKGTKVRVYRSGNKEITETSFYDILRDMEVGFDKIPVDASLKMEDHVMDLMEPYDYSALEKFREKYLSGFLAERYSEDEEAMSDRAKTKARDDSHILLEETINGYTAITNKEENIDIDKLQSQYALLPVWIYEYQYKNKLYTLYINGQTGKLIGKNPTSIAKMFSYTASVFALTSMIFFSLKEIISFFM